MKRLSGLSGLGWLLMVTLLALFTAGCSGRQPALTPTPGPAATVDPQTLPAVEAVALIESESGGAVRLRDGAEISLPPQALSAKAVVTLRALDASPAAPVPRSLLGRTYEFTLEGGELTGVALLRIPLPASVAADQYEVAPYRLNGTTWERINGRLTGAGYQFGANAPGVFALQGTWRLADATLALIKPETPPGQPAAPVAAAGQYRFSALPILNGEYVQAQLTLKQDVSGGAGRVSGNPALDATIAEATLWFQPDPTQPQGVIEFSHVFEVAPGSLEVPPGGTTRLYALLEVEDALAPTRRLSTGIEYTQMLPIQVVGMELVRPELAAEGQYLLRWHIRLNGQTFSLLEAAGARLALDDILARGGLGDYRFTLEAESAGAWITVSNEVTVQLALKPTETPPIVQEPTSGPVAITSPVPPTASPVPGEERPATPTRRPTPSTGGPAATATLTPLVGATAAVPTATVTRPAGASPFWADRYILNSGECTTLHWQVENVISVFLDGQPVTGGETRQVCPAQTTSYTLQVNSNAGTQYLNLAITVSTLGQSAIEFTADNSRIAPGGCTVLRWRVTDVRQVFLNGLGVAGEASQQVCPSIDTAYTLRVVNSNGTEASSTLNIVVSAEAIIDLRFWADQYTMRASTCTTLRWDVRNVREVFLDDQGVSGSGTRQVCPAGRQGYTIKAVTNDGLAAQQQVWLEAGEIALEAGEVVAQGIVNEVTRQGDLDPVTPGDQAGYRIIIDGINVLFAGSNGWSQAAVTLRLPQEFLQNTSQSSYNPVRWPINPGQLAEFRAACEGATCTLQITQKSYLYPRSP